MKILATKPYAIAGIATALAMCGPLQAASLADAFRDGCVTPLIENTPLGEADGLTAMRPGKASGIMTGKTWKVADGLVLQELSSGGYHGCRLTASAAPGGASDAEAAQAMVDAYGAIADGLMAEGGFGPRPAGSETEGVTVTGLQSVEPNADGKKVVVYVYHNTKSNHAYLFAADNGR